MAESERKYTYRVEIDAAQAKQQAEELRRTLERTMNADAQTAQLRQATAAMQAEQRRQTQAMQAESQMRVALVRAEANVAVQESKAAAATRIEMEKRITSEVRAQIRQRERDERLAQTAILQPTAGRRPFSVGGAVRNIDMLSGMAVGGLGAFGAAQLAQQAYASAQQGAQLMRQQSTFSEFATRMGQDATAIVEAVRRASNATITEFDAMGLASQVLASKFAVGSTDIAGDLETVTAASRRFSQIFLDENGAALSVQEIFARMVKYAREGNKELVDQFGVTNQAIAEAMGVTVDGLASAEGATLRWQGLVKVLSSEMERLGPAAMTSADRFEQSAARIEDARQRVQMAMAQPMAGVAEWGAGAVEGLITASRSAPIDLLAQQLRDNPRAPLAQAGDYDAAIRAVEAYNQAMEVSAQTTGSYADQLQRLLTNLANRGALDAGQVQELERLRRTLDAVALGLDAYSVAMSVTTMAGVENSTAIFGLVRSMGALQNMYEVGDMTLEQYGERMVALAARMREAADAGGYLNSQLADTYTMVGPLARGFERRSAGTPERQPFIDPEAGAFPLPEGRSAAQVRGLLAIDEWERLNDPLAAVKAQIEEIKRSTESLQIERLRVALVQPMADAQTAAEQLSAVMQSLGDDTTSTMTQSADAIQEQVTRLNMLDQAAQMVDQAMKNGVSSAGEMATTLTYMAAEVAATNTVTDAQVGILQRLIGALAGAEAAARGFAGAQTQYQAAMAAKNAKYSTYAGYNYGMLAPRMDGENREGTRQAMLDRANEERRAREEAQRAWESAAKKTASEFERAAEQAATAFESALRKVPGLFGASSVTGEQMAGAAAGVPQEFADNYLRRLADEVAGNKDWEGIDIADAARRAGIDGNLPKEQILAQFQSAWADSSLFAGGRNIDLITEYGGLDAIKANLARQEAGASGQQALLDFLSAQGLGPAVGAPGAPTTATAGLPTAEAAPDYAAEAVEAIEQAFAADDITAQLQIVGENTIAAIHAGYRANAGRLDWAGPLVDAVAAKVLATLNDAFDEP